MVGLRNVMPRVLVFFGLFQDLDLLLPVIGRAVARRRLAVTLCATRQLFKQFSWVRQELAATGLELKIVEHRGVVVGLQPRLKAYAALLTASESSAPAHRAGHALARRANRRGLRTYTLQHGLENVGLTYFGPDAQDVTFASERILIWGRVKDLPPETPADTRERCVAVGCPKEVEAHGPPPPLPPGRGRTVLVGENLHWGRYDEDYRRRFVADLRAAVEAFPNVTFVVKPHPAGRWLTQRAGEFLPARPNLMVVRPDDPAWRCVSTPALLAAVDAVVTTPSTVALDAARLGRPVAVAGYGLDLSAYAPLPAIESGVGWVEFVRSLGAGGARARARAAAFVDRVVVPGDSVARILHLIERDLGR